MLKKPYPFLYALLMVLMILPVACGTLKENGKASPGKVSETFFKALRDQDYELAKSLGTSETARMISVIQTLSGMGGGINILRDNKKELISCEIQEDRAICTYKAFSGPDEKVYLERQKGKWLVNLKGDQPTGNEKP